MKPIRYTDRERYPHGYTPASATDIRETFRRVRQEQVAQVEEGEFAEWVREAAELEKQ